MANLTASEFLKWLIDKQFLRESRAQSFRASAAANPDAMVLAKELIQRNVLTPYQVKQIFRGNGAGLLLGPFRLLERIGEGAMGQVFKCFDSKLERLVAVKMIHKENLASKKAMNRFRREMETAGQLHHPNIVLLRDADEVDGRPFMVMEYVDGTDLSRLVKHGGPLPIAQAAAFAQQAALGLQHACDRGVIHRDIKPGNLLLTRDKPPMVKISDFGLARFDSEQGAAGRLTQHGAVLGTIDYIAPEQAENAQAADIRADIYSLGCTLYYLLTAKPPFPGSTIVEKVSARLSGEPTDITTYRSDTPPGLVAVIKRMTARDPVDRYQSPQEVAKALEPFCVAETIPVARPIQPAAPVPMARPVAAHVAQSPAAIPVYERHEFALDDAPHVALATVAGEQQLDQLGLAQAKNRGWVALVSAGSVLSLLVVVLMIRGCGSAVPLDAYPANAGLAIALKEKKRTVKLGDHKFVIFKLKRTNFSGPVEVFLQNKPEGVGSVRVTVSAKKNEGELPLNVYFFAKAETSTIRIRAVAKNLMADDYLELTVINPSPDSAPAAVNQPR